MEQDPTDPNVATVDINRSIATVRNLAVAYFGEHVRVDLMLDPGAFTGDNNAKTLALSGEADMTIDMPPVGDVNGDGQVSALDAALILRASVGDPASVFPIYNQAANLTALLRSLGYTNADVMMQIADASGNGKLGALDASYVLQLAVAAPPVLSLSSGTKICKLSVNDYDAGRLEVSIDLDNVSDVYSADIVMAYDPSVLTVADVSKTSSTSQWLFADGAEAGKLRISLAGASQPMSDGSLVTITFDGDSLDAIKHLDIVDLKLNGGDLKATVENLPKAFALMQNYPNPFNPETWIPYQLTGPADVSISIYNVNGQMVRQLDLGSKLPGHYTDKSRAAYWDGKNKAGEEIASGLYFYSIVAGDFSAIRRMVVRR
jgi:hypothetical protein